ncbi:MAG: metallophosphoesterase family protein [bacterium]
MEFSFVQITDHHLGSTEHEYNHGYATAYALSRVMDDLAQSGAHGADFLICTGDLVNFGTAEEYAFARRFLDLRGRPVPPGPLTMSWNQLRGLPAYFVPGNHDIRHVFFDSLFSTTPPGLAANMAFVHKGVQFLCLDFGTGQRAGQVLPDTLSFLRERLTMRMPAVLMLHYHPIPVGIPWLDAAVPDRIAEFWDVVTAGQVLGVLFGHAHATVDAEVRGVPVLGLRSTNFQFAPAAQPLYCLLPPHYRVVTISGGRLASRIHEVSL